jgi:hypothetical protein
MQKIRSIEGLTETVFHKDKPIDIKWSVQWDDRLGAYYVFCFPTPILGVMEREDGSIAMFPVGGNLSMQAAAKRLVAKTLGLPQDD